MLDVHWTKLLKDLNVGQLNCTSQVKLTRRSATGRPPSTILGIRKRETLGYPMVKTATPDDPSAFPRFHTVPECDGRTDLQ